MSRRHTVEIDVELDEFTDDEIIAEVEFRKLGRVQLATGPDAAKKAAADLQAHLCSRRIAAAEKAMGVLLRELMPVEVCEALEAFVCARHSEAICRLDAYLHPSPAREAKRLPEKPKPAPAAPQETATS